MAGDAGSMKTIQSLRLNCCQDEAELLRIGRAGRAKLEKARRMRDSQQHASVSSAFTTATRG